MNKPPTPAVVAWQQDDFWKEVVSSMTKGDRLRPDAYLQTLTEEDLEQLRLCLFSSLDYAAMSLAAPKWRGGPHDGKPPGQSTLARLWEASRQAEVLRNVERNEILIQATRQKAQKLGLGNDEAMLDNILMVVAQEVMNETIKGQDPKNRTAAARLLLKRSDQKMERDKFTAAMKSKIELAFDELEEAFKGNEEALKHFNVARELVRKKVATS